MMITMGGRTQQVLSALDAYFAAAAEMTRSPSVAARSAEALVDHFNSMTEAIHEEMGETESTSELIQLEAGRALVTAILLDLSDARGQHLRSVE